MRLSICFKKLYLYCGFLSAALFLAACGETPVEPQSTDKIVGGVNVTQLFAAPTQAEIDAVRNDWRSRTIAVENFEVVEMEKITLGGGPATMRVVSHTVGGLKHFGAILSPDGAAPGSLPVIIYAHGGDNGMSINDLLVILQLLPGLAGEFVFVAPSYRDETLRKDGVDYRSDGPASPWDRDVDDTLSLLSAALENTPEADPESIGVLGLSRGACVGMLAAIRDSRIDVVVEYFGPTDFLGEFVRGVTEKALEGVVSSLPGADFAQEHIVDPLKNGAITLAEARLEILRRSPVYFAEDLPQLQVHHGTADDVVPVAEAERLIAVMEGLGRTAPGFESYLYPNVGHTPSFTSLPRVEAFLNRLLSAEAHKQLFPMNVSK